MDRDGTKKEPEPKINNFGCATLHFYFGFLYVEVGSGPSYSVQRPDRYNSTTIVYQRTSKGDKPHTATIVMCHRAKNVQNFLQIPMTIF